MKTSRYSTAGGGMLPRMSDSLPLFLSLMLSQCLSTPPLPFSLPDSFFPPLRRWKLSWPASQLSDAPLGEPDFTPDLTFTPQSILHSYIWVTHNFKKNPYSFKFFLHNSHFEEKIFPGQGFPIHMWKLTTSNRYFTFRTIPRGEDLLFNNADFFDFESSQWKPTTLMKMIQDTSDKLAWFWWISELTVRPLKKHLQANYREKICLTNRLL